MKGDATGIAALAYVKADRALHAPDEQARREQDQRIESQRLEIAVREDSWRPRLSPRKNPWPELSDYDDRIARLTAEHGAAAAECAQLEQDLAAAEAEHTAALARWFAAGQKGPRPEATTSPIRERLEARKVERDALPSAVDEVAREKHDFIERNRKRLKRHVDDHVDALEADALATIEKLAGLREELRAHRAAQLFVTFYPDAAASEEPMPFVAGGLAQPLKEATGYPIRLEIDKLCGCSAPTLRQSRRYCRRRRRRSRTPGPNASSTFGRTASGCTPEGQAALNRETKRLREEHERVWGPTLR